jgi:hypothetical protein
MTNPFSRAAESRFPCTVIVKVSKGVNLICYPRDLRNKCQVFFPLCIVKT